MHFVFVSFGVTSFFFPSLLAEHMAKNPSLKATELECNPGCALSCFAHVNICLESLSRKNTAFDGKYSIYSIIGQQTTGGGDAKSGTDSWKITQATEKLTEGGATGPEAESV